MGGAERVGGTDQKGQQDERTSETKGHMVMKKAKKFGRN